MSFALRLLHFLSASLLALLCSCQSARELVKADPTHLSGFLSHPDRMVRQKEGSAFHYSWVNPKKSAHQAARTISEIYIAPVTTKWLRPSRTGWLRGDERVAEVAHPEAESLAMDLQRYFTLAFQQASQPRYKVVSHPGKNTLTLELALIELSPTQISGNLVKESTKLVVGPLGNITTVVLDPNGRIAIEGKVSLSRTREPLYQFADRESDKMTLYSLRDFSRWGHARVAMREWASEFEELTRRGVAYPVADASFWTLMLW